jgi:hypothetical protein
MRLGTVTIIRLKGTFRHFSSSIQYRSGGCGAANRVASANPKLTLSSGAECRRC